MNEDEKLFGKGFTYNLSLFIAERVYESTNSLIWFRRATDHLQSLVIPENKISIMLRHKIEDFVEKCVKFKEGAPVHKNIYDMIKEAESILMDVDTQVFEINTIKSESD